MPNIVNVKLAVPGSIANWLQQYDILAEAQTRPDLPEPEKEWRLALLSDDAQVVKRGKGVQVVITVTRAAALEMLRELAERARTERNLPADDGDRPFSPRAVEQFVARYREQGLA